ncbi:RNA methyltransferase [Candidatus Cloacimonadota bacterium]
MKKKNRNYLGLVHFPVYNKFKDTVTTSITNLDIHDIARSCRTFDVKGFYIINPLPTQKKILERILKFWESDIAGKYNSDRVDALQLVHYADSVGSAIKNIKIQEGKRPILITTTAAQRDKHISFREVKLIEEPRLILFGTGNGLTNELHDMADHILEPIEGGSYNHLSVRSAAAIVLDRLTSEK